MKVKRFISAFLTVTLLLGAVVFSTVTTAASDMPFKDVGEKKWFYDEVLYVYEKGLMTGTSNDKFEPNASLTRAMFITILGRLAGAEETASDKFSDIKKNSWYAGYVGWAVDNGIVTGYEDGTFKPNKALTREEMAACISRYVDFMGIKMPRENTAPAEFADKSKIAKWARDYVDVLRRAGIANGDQSQKYNPKANITRAEMATVIMNLIAAEAKAWQGYVPSATDDAIILGAKYLYSGGTIVAGGLETDLRTDESFPYPALEAYKDDFAPIRTYLPANTTGISFNVIDHKFADYPFLKVCYKYENSAKDTPVAKLYCDAASLGEAVTTAGADDDGWKTLVIDISAILSANSGINDKIRFTQLLFEPFADSDGEDARFLMRYVGLFKDKSSAENYASEKDSDYLKNYYLYSPVTMEEISETKLAEYDKLLVERIKEIKNSESEITPEMIEAAGGKCYYISSVNGDDSNNGLTPETAWKSPVKLWDIKANGLAWISVPKAGDGVFFERGSTFYADDDYKYTVPGFTSGIPALLCTSDITYGAYGEGEKPMFTAAVDFTDSDNVGVWNETEWDNIYVLDSRYDPEIKRDLGLIVFNKGEGVAIRMIPSDLNDHFGEGKTVIDRGLCCNGYEYYYTGEKSCENVGIALTNDLEMFYDSASAKLYLYSKDGNPADRFEDIKVAPCRGAVRHMTSSGGGDCKNIRIDNIAVLYSSDVLLDMGNENIEISNCEIGYCLGSLSSIEHSVGVCALTNNYIIRNCYSHDIGDGAATNQGGGPDDGVRHYHGNITYENNVFITSGIGAEIWYGTGPNLEDGLPEGIVKNVNVKGNMIAYIGYGITNKQASHKELESKLPAMVDSSADTEIDPSSVVEENIYMHSRGCILRAYLSADNQPRGWSLRNNTYILNKDYSALMYHFDNVHLMLDHATDKYRRILSPYNERYLAFWASNGFDPSGEYYCYETDSDFGILDGYFTTSYYIENGISPVSPK